MVVVVVMMMMMGVGGGDDVVWRFSDGESSQFMKWPCRGVFTW